MSYPSHHVLILAQVASAAYNRFHDQLLLSCGTDCNVNLWRAASISSTPMTDFGQEAMDLAGTEVNSLVKRYEDHESLSLESSGALLTHGPLHHSRWTVSASSTTYHQQRNTRFCSKFKLN